MNRRSFIRLLAGTTAAAVAPKPTYFFAPIGGWASDVILSPYAGRTAAGAEMMFYAAHERLIAYHRLIAEEANLQFQKRMTECFDHCILYGDGTSADPYRVPFNV